MGCTTAGLTQWLHFPSADCSPHLSTCFPWRCCFALEVFLSSSPKTITAATAPLQQLSLSSLSLEVSRTRTSPQGCLQNHVHPCLSYSAPFPHFSSPHLSLPCIFLSLCSSALPQESTEGSFARCSEDPGKAADKAPPSAQTHWP